MKNMLKFWRIIAFAAVIVFSMIGCGEDGSNDNKSGDDSINFSDAKWRNIDVYNGISGVLYNGSNVTFTKVDGYTFSEVSSNPSVWNIKIENNKLSIALGIPDKAAYSDLIPDSINPDGLKVVVYEEFVDDKDNILLVTDPDSNINNWILFAYADKAGIVTGNVDSKGSMMSYNLNLKAGWNTIIYTEDNNTRTGSITTGVPGSNYKWCLFEYEGGDTTAPTLTEGNVNRISNTAATIGFTTNEVGTAYYLVKESGEAAPENTAVITGTSLGLVYGTVTGKTVTLTEGAKDIYVVVEDAMGNISAVLKIEAAAYVNIIDYQNYSDFSIKVTNYSGQNLVAFKGTPGSSTLISGIPAFAENHGLRKDESIFSITESFSLYLVPEDVYLANQSNFSAITQASAKLFAFFDAMENSSYHVAISELLFSGSYGYVNVQNSSQYGFELRQNSITGATIGYVEANAYERIYLPFDKDLNIYLVCIYYDNISNEIIEKYPINFEGKPINYLFFLSNDNPSPSIAITPDIILID